MNQAAPQLVASAKAILLDFDGPVTALMPAPLNAAAADRARQPLLQAAITLPTDVAATTDHLTVLRFAATAGPDLLAQVEEECLASEVAAARISAPTDGASDFLARCRSSDKPVVIVSNNAAEAIDVYLGRFHIRGMVRGVVGRQPQRPDLMKPHPSLLKAAVELTGYSKQHCLMIGDSVTDVEAARTEGISALGFGKTPRRHNELLSAGACAVFDHWADFEA